MASPAQLTPQVLSSTGQPFTENEIYAMVYRNALDTEEQRERARLINNRIVDLAVSHSMLLPRLHHSRNLPRVSKATLLSTMGIFIVLNEQYPDSEFRRSMFYQVMGALWACTGLSVPSGGTNRWNQLGVSMLSQLVALTNYLKFLDIWYKANLCSVLAAFQNPAVAPDLEDGLSSVLGP